VSLIIKLYTMIMNVKPDGYLIQAVQEMFLVLPVWKCFLYCLYEIAICCSAKNISL